MRGLSDDDDSRAISGLAQPGVFGCTTGPKIPSHADIADRAMWFALLSRKLWNATAPAALDDLIGRHIEQDSRTSRKWSRGDTEPSAHVLWLLLRSNEGYRALRFIMDHEPPAWWVNSERHRQLGADVERRVREGD